MESARSIRAALTEEQHEELERLGNELFTKIFASAGDEAESPTNGRHPPAPGNFN
jgi:hypothetical protein